MRYNTRGLLITTTLIIGLLAFNGNAASYERVLDDKGQISPYVIRRVADGAFIPINPNNRDYKEFLNLQKKGKLVIKTPTSAPPALDPVKEQAKKDLNDKTKTPDQRIDALIKILNLAQ